MNLQEDNVKRKTDRKRYMKEVKRDRKKKMRKTC